MAKNFEVLAELRPSVGKNHSRRIRRQDNKIPAIIYGAGTDPMAVSLDHNKIQKALENEAFYSHILIIDIAGKQEKAILRAIQRHPYKAKILHMDFQRVSAKEKLNMNVPLHFVGEENAPGVKTRGGMVSRLVTNVEVSCLPDNLPEFIEVDVSHLDVDQSLHLSDLKLPEGVELVELLSSKENDLPVVNIYVPRAMAEEKPVEAAPTTEVIEKAPKSKE